MKKTFKKSGKVQLEKEISWLLEEKHRGKKTDAFFSDITRLEKGEPADYVIGFTPFLGCHIDLSHLPLIPRTETEFWVERAVQKILSENKTEQRSIHCLDLFSGSGCIGIALACHIKSATVDFGDNKDNCLEQIKKNLEKNKVANSRTNIYKSDCLQNIPQKKYDYLFANPPYVARERQEHVQKSVIAWEPRHALFAKDDGLYYIKKIIREAPNFLKKNGSIFIEFDSCQKETIEKLVPKDIYKYTFWKDQFGKWRVVVLQNLPAGRQEMTRCLYNNKNNCGII